MKIHILYLLTLASFIYCIPFSIYGADQLSKRVEKNRACVTDNDTIHVIGHALIDMNLLWTYFDTMKMMNDSLRQTVVFMDEFPDYTMVPIEVYETLSLALVKLRFLSMS
ncbi:MAG: hypothetical protein PHT18_00795 [Proteiniphilum sp.]|nr:hypothetical protein [Proteiniphilum sp.]